MDFEAVYRLYFKDVYLYLRGLGADETTAEETAQEAFVKALSAIDRFDGGKDIRAWLFTIARNTLFDDKRRRKRLMPEEAAGEVPSGEPAVVDRLVGEETAWRVHAFLHTMQEPYKEVFTLRVFGELPFARIGALFGKSDGWARVVYHRAKQQILTYMEDMEHEHQL